MGEEFNFRKGDIVKQRNTSVLDIYGEVIVADSYQKTIWLWILVRVEDELKCLKADLRLYLGDK